MNLRAAELKFKIAAILISFWSPMAKAELCKKWSEASEVGQILSATIAEQSGLAASAPHSRLFHINDSGDGAKLYVTDTAGKLQSTVIYSDLFPFDVEDLGYGRCDQSSDKKCLYIGDIGDNFGIRPTITFHVVEELANWPTKVKSVRTIQVRYPDRRHDSEAFAIHPNGDLYLVTKSYSASKALVSTVFKLDANKVQAGGIQTFTKVGEIDIPKIVGSNKGTNVVTSMSISPDGTRFLLLTYNDVIEFSIDLSKAFPTTLRSGLEFQVVKIKKLAQSEAISYSNDGKSFFYSTEARRAFVTRPDSVPLMNVRCDSI